MRLHIIVVALTLCVSAVLASPMIGVYLVQCSSYIVIDEGHSPWLHREASVWRDAPLWGLRIGASVNFFACSTWDRMNQRELSTQVPRQEKQRYNWQLARNFSLISLFAVAVACQWISTRATGILLQVSMYYQLNNERYEQVVKVKGKNNSALSEQVAW